MFNIQPGHGLGFESSREIAFGLEPSISTVYVSLPALYAFTKRKITTVFNKSVLPGVTIKIKINRCFAGF